MYQGARRFHRGRAHFDRNSLSAMRIRSVFRILWPGIAAFQERIVGKGSLLAYNIITSGIQTLIKNCCMLPEVFQSFSFPSCKSRVLLRWAFRTYNIWDRSVPFRYVDHPRKQLNKMCSDSTSCRYTFNECVDFRNCLIMFVLKGGIIV